MASYPLKRVNEALCIPRYQTASKIIFPLPVCPYYLCIPRAFDFAVAAAKIPPTEPDKVIDTTDYGCEI